MTKTTIYIISTERFGESQFVFDDKFKLIDGWQRNDADYRDEYMSGFLKHLGIQVKKSLPASQDANKLMKAAAMKLWGIEDDE